MSTKPYKAKSISGAERLARRLLNQREVTESILARCANERKAAMLALNLIMAGVARIEPSTKEFCFNGLRYSVRDADWAGVINVIGETKVLNAIRDARSG